MPRVRPSAAGLMVAALLGLTALGLFLRLAFAGSLHVDPVAFRLGPVAVHWYGLFGMLALALGLPWTIARAKRAGLPAGTAESALIAATLMGLVGARLVYVLENLPYYSGHAAEILHVATGGLSVHGMLLGGFLGAAAACTVLGIDPWRLVDAAVPALLFGMVLGRFGNFTNAEILGYPTAVPWKMFVEPAARPVLYAGAAYFHPVFLYDAALNAAVLAGLLVLERRAVFRGERFFWFLAAVSVTRFVVEHWRINEPSTVGIVSPAQWTSLALAAVAAVVIALGRTRLLGFERV